MELKEVVHEKNKTLAECNAQLHHIRDGKKNVDLEFDRTREELQRTKFEMGGQNQELEG
jgi:hypothetical protein